MAGLWTDGQRARLADLTASAANRMNTAPMNQEDMDRALSTGDATALGDFPGAPVRFQSIWRVKSGSVWRAVDDDTQALFNRDADRYQLAVAAMDGLAAVALAHPVSAQQLAEFVAAVSVNDLPERMRTREGSVALWGKLDAPVGCGAWAVAWPPGAVAARHHHGASLAAFAVLEGELTVEEAMPVGEAASKAEGPAAAARRLGAGEVHGLGAGVGHQLRNLGGPGADQWAFTAHAGWLVHPSSCHAHVPGAVGAVDLFRRDAA